MRFLKKLRRIASEVPSRQAATLELLETRQLMSGSPATPVALTPGTTTAPGPVLTTLTPTFKWSAVSGVTGYEIHIFDNTSKAYLSKDVGASVTSFTPAPGTFHAGDKFVWNVRDIVGTSTLGPSKYLNFQTPALPAPVVIGPGSSVSPGPVLSTLEPTFSWKPVTVITGFTGYQINLYDIDTKKGVSFYTSASATSYTLSTPLAANNHYVWNLRLDNGSQTGAESLPYLYFETAGVKTLPAPVALSPGNANASGPVLSTLDPTFKWTTVAGVSGYQINIYDITASHIAASVNVGSSVDSYTPAPGTLRAGDRFVWNVRDVVGTATGAVSNYLYFQTPALPAPVVIGPGSSTSPGTVIDSLTPTFSWDAVTSISGFTGYQINLYDITSKRFVSFYTNPTVTHFELPSGTLTAGDDYIWNLRLDNGSQTGAESLPYLYFSVA